MTAIIPYIDIIFQVTETRITKEGTPLLFPEINIETFWTNLYESPEKVIDLYHDHGTSEEFHSELKSDMNVERLRKVIDDLIRVAEKIVRHAR